MKRLWGQDILIPAAIFAVVLSTSYFFSHIGIDPHHDGLMLKNAVDVYNGKMLFKESYTPYGALTTLIHSWFMMLFGVKLLSLKIASSIFYASSGVLLWLISRHFLSKNYSLAVILLWVGNLPFFTDPLYPWASIYATFFVLLTQYTILTAISLKKSQRLHYFLYALSGALATCAFWCKQPYGTVLCALIIIPLIRWYIQKKPSRKYVLEIVSVIAGAVIVHGIFFGWLIYNNSLGDWFVETVRLGYITGRVLGEHFSVLDFFSVLIHNPLGLLLPLSVGYLLMTEGKNIFQGKKADLKKISLALLASSALLSYYPLYDLSHRFWAGTPSYAVLGIAIYNVARYRVKNFVYAMILLLIGFCVAFDSTRSIISGLNKVAVPYRSITYPSILSGVRVSAKEEEGYKELASKMDTYFRTHPGSTFIVLGGDALSLTFTSYSHNTGPYFVDFSDITSGIYPYNQRLDEYISKFRPLVLVTKVPPVIPPNYKKIGEWPVFHGVLVIPIK